MSDTTTEKLNKLDSLSNLGSDNVILTEETTPEAETETMKVQPLKAIAKEEYEALLLLTNLVNEVNEKAGVTADEKVNPMSDVTSKTEQELYIKLAEKFGLKNIELLKDTNVRFRLRSGYFIEVYNA